MRKYRPRWKTLSVLVLAIAAGCAQQPRSTGRTAGMRPSTAPIRVAGNRPATQPLGPNARLTLDQIEPAVSIPPAPATAPANDRAPLEAIELYAKARDALLENRRYTAIGLLERAIVLDPTSFELQYALGKANLGAGNSTDRAIEAFEKAAELRPDDLDVRLQLGRQYLVRGAPDKALRHLRIGRLTDDYQSEEDLATVTDLLLARTLQQKDYDRAALDEYKLVLERLKRPTPAMRTNAELVYLMNRPEVLLGQVALLSEKFGEYEAALGACEQAIERDPASFDLQSRSVRLMVALGRNTQAASRAAEVVRRFRASTDSMALLRDVFRQIGRENGVVEELTKLHNDRPEDRAILFTLADSLKQDGRAAEAERLLADAVAAQKYDTELVRRLYRTYVDDHKVEDAARLLMETLGARPDALREVTPLWTELLQPSRKNRLRLPQLQKIQVSDRAEAAKMFWVSRIADLWGRDATAKTALAQSSKSKTPFPPTYRTLMQQLWQRADWDDAQKTEESATMVESVRQLGSPGLAAELRGISLLHQKKPDQALEALGEAQKLQGSSPDLTLIYASALIAQGRAAQAEQMLWKLVSDYPTCEDGYEALFRYYLNQNSPAQALKVLQTWLAADPQSMQARLLQATVYLQGQRGDQAEQLLDQLLADYADNAEVLQTTQLLYMQGGRLDEFVRKLESLRQKNPENREAVARLVAIYEDQKKIPEAMKVLGETRAAVSNDPDLLYYVSHLYTGIGQKDEGERLLAEVVKLDPTHSGAANDLGYTWADEGRNLPEAERLIRLAVRNEPDNQSFLDSLGWVQYKRGNFDDATRSLEAALANTSRPDPVVLDHLGDALYRTGRRSDAVKQWQRAFAQLQQTARGGDDVVALRQSLPQKLKQAEDGQAVTVAPIASESATRPAQARGGGTNDN